MTEKEKKTNSWIQIIEKYDEITINEIKYLYNNIPDNLNRRKKQKMEYFLTRFSNSLTCKLYDLKFFIANKCK